VRGNRVWLGLRGPVLRGHAVVLDLELLPKARDRLKARRIDGATLPQASARHSRAGDP
jgi:hypothetical protein